MRYAILIIAIVLFIPACASPVKASTQDTLEPSIAAQYDANGNNIIDKDEAISAITDYLFGQGDNALTKAEVTEIITLYLFGGPITRKQVTQESLGDVIARVRPSIVKVKNSIGQGSGVIHKTDAKYAYIVTNQHVVGHDETVTVTVKDTNSLEGEVLGVDAARDLAVVKIPCTDCTALAFGDSENLRQGDTVVAVGYPRDRIQPKDTPKRIINPSSISVSTGIVSAFRYDSENDRQLV